VRGRLSHNRHLHQCHHIIILIISQQQQQLQPNYPIAVDVGTDNVDLRNDALYLGERQPRITGQDYFDVVDEFMSAIGTISMRAVAAAAVAAVVVVAVVVAVVLSHTVCSPVSLLSQCSAFRIVGFN
jgi:hypothetical protein